MARFITRYLVLTAPALLIGPNLRAQTAGDQTQPTQVEVLQQAIRTMAKLNSLSFQTTEEQNSAMSRTIMRQAGGLMGGSPEVDVRGRWANGVLSASLNDGDDEIMTYRGRQIARNDDVSWKLRRNRTVTGADVPFVLDPSRVFETLGTLSIKALEVRNASPTG